MRPYDRRDDRVIAGIEQPESLSMIDNEETEPTAPVFDPAAYSEDTLIHDRRQGGDRRRTGAAGEAIEPIPRGREKQNRRRRIDPTTFEKQYTDDELEFMNAMQRYKIQSGKAFPTHGDPCESPSGWAIGRSTRASIASSTPRRSPMTSEVRTARGNWRSGGVADETRLQDVPGFTRPGGPARGDGDFSRLHRRACQRERPEAARGFGALKDASGNDVSPGQREIATTAGACSRFDQA